jgi:hypothetical protein
MPRSASDAGESVTQCAILSSPQAKPVKPPAKPRVSLPTVTPRAREGARAAAARALRRFVDVDRDEVTVGRDDVAR